MCKHSDHSDAQCEMGGVDSFMKSLEMINFDFMSSMGSSLCRGRSQCVWLARFHAEGQAAPTALTAGNPGES